MNYNSFFSQIDAGLNDRNGSSSESYHKIIINNLKKIIAEDHFLYQDPISVSCKSCREEFHQTLPILKMTEIGEVPCKPSFLFLSKARQNSFKFFFDMLSSWLVPSKRLDVFLFHASDFRVPSLGDDLYTICEIKMNVDSEEELEEIQKNYPTFEKELCLGIASIDYARRILEIKGLSTDEKTALIQDYISSLVKRRPEDFDNDIFIEMQHVLVMCPDVFKNIRESRHLSRIIGFHYLFRKALIHAIDVAPGKRHLYLKLFRAKLRLKTSKKTVLGIIVGLNFLDDKEIFEDRHLLKALQYYVPEAQIVPDSFFSLQRGVDNIATMYLEVEKEDGDDFTAPEIQRLRQELPGDLHDRIEQLMHPIFMPRNEEEIMRNIVTLSHQLNFISDNPQLLISFDEQTHSNLFFTIIMVRVINQRSESLLDLFSQADTFLEYYHDFTKQVGSIGKSKQHKKEATVFRVKLPKDMFLREDHSIDLYKARQVVLAEMERVLGSVRDLYGGLISKQNEILSALRSLLAEEGTFNDFLLENFFYSLTPTVFRSAFDPNALKTLFIMLLNALQQEGSCSFDECRELDKVFVMISVECPKMKSYFDGAISNINIPTAQLGQVFLFANDTPCLGYIFCCDDPYNQEHFCQTLKQTFDKIVFASV